MDIHSRHLLRTNEEYRSGKFEVTLIVGCGPTSLGTIEKKTISGDELQKGLNEGYLIYNNQKTAFQWE